MAIIPTPGACVACGDGGGGGGDSVDVEDLILCDFNADGEIVGSAVAVYTYDSDGNPTGPPTFVVPGTNTPYVPVGTLRPCATDSGGAGGVFQLCDVQVDNSSVVFIRHYLFNPDGTIASFHDSLPDGSPYVPTGAVGDCDPYTTCVPSPDVDLAGTCGPGETPDVVIITNDTSAPLANSVFNDDASADPLCGGQWDRPADALTAPFPVAETFRNLTFDQPGPVTQANWAGGPFLTAGPPTNDGAGQGWIRLSDGTYASGGVWQIPTPFPTADGINAAVTLASHDGTTPGGDGQYFVFTNGAGAPQSTIVGGFGNLGLNNIDNGVFAIVLDEYGQSCTCGQGVPADPFAGACGFCSNTISIQRAGLSRVGASCGQCTIAQAPLAPKNINQTTRSQPLRLLASVVEEGGQTYVSASIDWNDGNGPVQYFNRVNVTALGLVVPPSLRMGLVMNSGGAFQAIKEARDAVARPAGVSNWRGFPIQTDPIPACVTSVNVTARVDVTFIDDGTQVVANANPEAYFWLVNSLTGVVLDRQQLSAQPAQIGNVQSLEINALVPIADLPNLRVYVGAESRDENGEYATLWENLDIDVAGIGCPATPVRTLAISAPCPIPVTIVGGSGDAPAPVTVVNTPSTFEDEPVCVVVAGVQQTAFRREQRDSDGTVTVTFTGAGGVAVTPDGPFVPGTCPENTVLGPVCFVDQPVPAGSRNGFLTLDVNGDPVLYDGSGNIVADGAYLIVICPDITVDSQILCDTVATGDPLSPFAVTQFLRWYLESPIVGVSDTVWDFTLDGSTPYVVAGIVSSCASVVDVEQEILCDFGNLDGPGGTPHQFIREYAFQTVTGQRFSQTARDLQTGALYAVIGPVGVCGGAQSDQLDVEVEVLCDNAGVRFLRRYIYNATDSVVVSVTDTTLDGTTVFAPALPVTTCATPVTITNQEDDEYLILCSSTPVAGTQFLRRYRVDADTGLVIAVVNTTLDGVTPFVPGVVSVCAQVVATDLDFAEEVLCDNNGGFIRRFTFNSTTGAVTATVNLTLAGAAYVPVGTVGVCDSCCPIEIGQGCTNVGSGRYTALRLASGVISLIDSVSGATVLAANIIVCPSDDVARTLTAQARLLTAGQSWTPGADVVGTLTGVSFTVLTGTATLTDENGTVSAGLPPGVTGAWNVEDDNTLTGPDSIDAIGGNTWVTWTVR